MLPKSSNLGNFLAIGRAWNAVVICSYFQLKVMDPHNLSPNYQGLNQNSTFAATKLSNKETVAGK